MAQKTSKTKYYDGVCVCRPVPALVSLRERIKSIYVDEFKNLLLNSFSQPNIGFRESNFYKSKQLFTGCVGVDLITDSVAAVTGSGLDFYGYPKRGWFVSGNGKSWERALSYEPNPQGAYIIYALPTFNNFSPLILHTADILTQLTIGVRQNAIAMQTPAFYVVDDPNEVYSMRATLEQVVEGAPAVIAKRNIAANFGSIKNETPFVADKLKALAREFETDFLTKVGILSANTQKRERVQSAEVNASVGECVDRIYTVIDTNNKQCDEYGLIKYKYELNGSVERLYADELEAAAEPQRNFE